MSGRILIVEDNAIIAMLVDELLCNEGLDVVGVAQDAAEAIDIASREHPDLVLSDIRLPGARDGIDAAVVIKGRENTPVIFLTAASDERTIERARAAQPLAYLDKSRDLYRVGEVVKLALESTRLDGAPGR